jgi:hypothetical protein
VKQKRGELADDFHRSPVDYLMEVIEGDNVMQILVSLAVLDMLVDGCTCFFFYQYSPHVIFL